MRLRASGCGRTPFSLTGLVLLSGLALGAIPVEAATLTVTNSNDTGAGSFRQAITTANTTAVADTITFKIGTGVRTIVPQTPLPSITQPLIIDGTSQPGFAGKPLIVLNGAQAGPAGSGVPGLRLRAASCTVKSLVINGFGGSGIFIEGAGASGNSVKGCFIGTNVGGTAAVGNASNGITIFAGSGNTIGGLTAAERNVLSGNANGIDLINADNNKIQGNYIGTTVTGNAALPNGNAGIFVEAGAKNNVIGGAQTAARNVISGNGGTGIIFFDSGTDGNKVQGNYIGTNATGLAAIPNHADGVSVGNGTGRGGPKNTLIGGSTSATGGAPGNIIAGNDGNGIGVSGVGSDNTLIQGNYLGVAANGVAAIKPVGASGAGVFISNGAQSTAVGGTSALVRNIISGNDTGVFVQGDGAADNLNVSNTVRGNYIGTNVSGRGAVGNRLGVLIVSSKNNTIGGAATNLGQPPGNLIAGNREFHVRIVGDGASNNTVQGNLLGLNDIGAAALSTASTGVGIDGGAKNNLIGGATSNLRNVISGNNTGLQIQGAGTDGNKIQGNYIGINKAGTAAIANIGTGIVLNGTAKNNLIGGIATRRGQPPGNVIAGSGAGGIVIIDNGTELNTVQGNCIGTNAAGTAAILNTQGGVTMLEGASRNTVGGTSTGAGNLISGNEVGVAMHVGATANTVQGNYIGTDITGLKAVPNVFAGVLITSSAEQNIIGGTTVAARNIISGNSTGISIDNDGTDGNIVQGNYIGVNANRAALGNTVVGVEVTSGSSGNLVGAAARANEAATRAGANVIAFNGNSGVRVSEETTANCTIRGNFIFGNGGLGINLEPPNENPDARTANSPTPNDSGDADVGPNHLQNFPILTAVSSAGGSTTITGKLNSRPGATYVLDFYRSTQGDASGFGEGEFYLGAKRVTVDAAGNASFSFSASGTFSATTVSATATNLTTGETSEFSPLSQSNIVTNTNNSGAGSLRTALLVAASADNTTVRFNIPASFASGGVFTIKPLTPLPALSRNGTILDGTTQTAFGGNTNADGPEIVINGGALGAGSLGAGLTINGDDCVVRSLVVNQFPTGINIEAIGTGGTNVIASGNRIEGCYIGTTPAGKASSTVGIQDDGVRLADDGFTPGTGAANNVIGGLTAGAGNVISNCGRYGVIMGGGATSGNLVQGNFIGTDPAGASPVPNARGIGIFSGAHENVIGGTSAAARNLIFGNEEIGIVFISQTGTNANKVQGNYIGVNRDGSAALVTGANVPDIFGVRITDGAQSNLVGGSESGAGNVISGLTNGIGLTGIGTNFNVIQGNFIGLNAGGTAAIPNVGNGVIVSAGAQNNVIGAARNATGTQILSAGNRVAYNAGGDGIRIFASAADRTIGNTIRGNRVFRNGGLGINLLPDTEGAAVPTPNDAGDADAGPNNLQNFPVITGAQLSGTSAVSGTVDITFNSRPSTTFALDFYRVSAPDPTGFGEGEFYLGTRTVTTDSSGNYKNTLSFNLGGNFAEQSLCATATNLSTGDTSEFGPSQMLVGTVNTWGYNNLGQLGDGSTANKLLPQAINLNGAVAISAGGAHSLAVKSDGTVWAWGNNGSGQLGDGTGNNRLTPVQVPGLFEVQDVAGGWYHSLALKRDGTVWAWGSNSFGQLGDGTTLVSALPVRVQGLSNIVAITAGVYYSVALKSDGTVWAWGNNFYGQLGDGTKTDRSTPVQVKGVSGVRAIAAGAGHTVILKSDGTVQTFGWNANGQLGTGTKIDSLTPVTVSGLPRAGLIAAGYAHTLAAEASGAGVSAWGSNASGQLGDGTTSANRLTPVRVSGLSGVRLLAAGSSHSLAVKNDGTLWSWGNNIYGAVGDGTTTNRTVPVQTQGLGNIDSVSGGFSHSMALGTRAGATQARVSARTVVFVWSNVTATASAGTVQLSSPVGLASTAGDAAHYAVTVNGVDVEVQSASYSAVRNTVTLKLPPGAFGGEDEVAVTWWGLRDQHNQLLPDGQQIATKSGR